MNCPTHFRRAGRAPAGFTLVELLVVIGIIALLVSILLPTLSRARESANSVKCLSNVRSIGQSFIQFANDNDGAMIETSPYPGGGGYVMFVLSEGGYLDLQDNPEIQQCPSTSGPGGTSADGIGFAGTATNFWVLTEPKDMLPDVPGLQAPDSEGGYTYNGWVAYQPAPDPLFVQKVEGDIIAASFMADVGILQSRDLDADRLFFGKLARVDDSVNTPFLGDGVWRESFPLEWTLPAQSDTDPWPQAGIRGTNDANAGMINRYYVDRHDGGVNLAFVDGHAAKVKPLTELWRLRWHGEWDYQFVDQTVIDQW